MTRDTLVFTSVCLLSLLVGTEPLGAEPRRRAVEPETQAADSLLLDQYPDAYAAYGLRKLRSGYSGPALRVRRGSDGAEKNFGFAADGKLDDGAIGEWLGGADGYVKTWYSQVQGEPDLVQTAPTRQPRIAEAGTVLTDSDGRVSIKFDRARTTYLTLESGLSSAVSIHESLIYGVGENLGGEGTQGIINLAAIGSWSHYSFSFRKSGDGGFTVRDGVSGQSWPSFGNPGFWAFNHNGSTQKIFSNHAVVVSESLDGTVSRSSLTLGVLTKDQDEGYDGYLTEVAILPGQTTEADVQAVYDDVNAVWGLGPTDYNPEAIIPQEKAWQVTLYDWLETISVEDVTLPEKSMEWAGSSVGKAKMTELFLQTESASASRVVNSAPEWYVLDAGNGRGIEATGTVRLYHTPGYGGLERSWSNEPAFLYQLSVPGPDGTEGNEYKGDPALGRRALVVAMVDMMMYMTDGGYTEWTDMHGKALLGWAETYRWTKDLLPAEVKQAYEKGMERSLDLIIDKGARAVNTNMDMFPMHAAGEIYAAAESQVVKEKAVKAVKRTLLGSVNADQVGGPNHEVYATGGDQNGVFAPAGYIMEGDQPEVFYNGESYYHLLGTYSAVMDPGTGEVPGEWSFLEEVLRRMSEWKAYQTFYDPGRHGEGGLSDKNVYTAGAGFAGRTSAGEPLNQANKVWRDLTAASLFEEARYLSWSLPSGGPESDATKLPAQWKMEEKITSNLSGLTSSLNSVNKGEPPEWGGWSPWTKATAYLPQDGWHTNLESLQENKDSSTYIPVERSGTYNKTFGGPPTGKEFWAYKEEDESGNQWGFFLEADARQGGYGGWYGGKIETFWTRDTGIVLMNRHGKTGCDDNLEDSVCWDNLDSKAGHHVWGRDENGNGFTTLLLRGRDISRTSTFSVDGVPSTVTVNNVFNDPNIPETSSRTGEQTGSEIEGDFEVKNEFEAKSNGLTVTHTLTSDETDEVGQLWATLPVYLKAKRKGSWGMQMGYENTSIEYWNGNAWKTMPEDTDEDDMPEMIGTTALRLGRDFELGDGIQYAYVDFASSQSLRLAGDIYSDPYQTRQMFRSVHIDLHGNPGTVKTLPAERSVSYTIQTTDPTTEGGTSARQEIHLKEGGNVVSSFVSPIAPAMDSVFAGLQSEIAVVENEAGEQYRPGKDIDEIGQWESGEAYLIQARSDVTLSMHGEPLGTSSVALEQGWNLVPYLPSSSLPVEEAVSAISEDLVLLKDETGRSYSPDKGIDVLEQMEPGEGYKIYVDQSTTLNYPDSSN